MKPVVLPMLDLLLLNLLGLNQFGFGENRDGLVWDVGLLAAGRSQHSLEFVREYFDEARKHLVPVVENPFCAGAGSQFKVAQQEISDDLHIRLLEQRLQIN